MCSLDAAQSIEGGGLGAAWVGQFQLLEGEDEIGVGEAEGGEELSVVVVDGGVEGPSDLVLHHEVFVDAAADVVILVGVVARDERQLYR